MVVLNIYCGMCIETVYFLCMNGHQAELSTPMKGLQAYYRSIHVSGMNIYFVELMEANLWFKICPFSRNRGKKGMQYFTKKCHRAGWVPHMCGFGPQILVAHLVRSIVPNTGRGFQGWRQVDEWPQRRSWLLHSKCAFGIREDWKDLCMLICLEMSPRE